MSSVLPDDPLDMDGLAGAAGEPGELFVAPTSFAQARLWLLDRIEPGLAAYNVPLALTLSGPLAPAALAAALDALAARHETLRTAFAEEVDESG